MASAAIELRNVTLSFDKKGRVETPTSVFHDLHLSIAKSEVYVLIGPSGEGKSSLLKLMAGLLEPSAGEVSIHGKSWRSMQSSERSQVTQKMGMLFQKNALFDSLTVFENVAFPMRETTQEAKRLNEKQIRETVDFYLEAVGLRAACDLYPDEISGGMQKRLGIARALALKPEIVLYDDPTAGLDPITSRKIIHLIQDLQREMGTTVVAVTNDMKRAEQLAQRIGMLVDGQLIDCGSFSETLLCPDPRVQQFIRGRLEGPLTVLV